MFRVTNLDDYIHLNESSLFNKEIAPASRKFIVCSAYINLHGRDKALTELERFHEGLGLEVLQSLSLSKSDSIWHFYNPGIVVRSQYIDIWAYLESVIGARIRFMITLSKVERGDGMFERDKCTLVILLSINHDYNSVILNRLRSALVGIFGPQSQGVYEHLQITIIFNNIRIIYNDNESEMMNTRLPSVFPASNYISFTF